MVAHQPIDERQPGSEPTPRGDPPPAELHEAPLLNLDADAGGGEFLARMSLEAKAITDGFGGYPLAYGFSVDIWFLAFLRVMARFGVFSFGPITIYVPLIEPAVLASAVEEHETGELVRFTERVRAEQIRSGRKRIDELHALLAFMRTPEGVPARVFGELGVSPEQVEAFARNGGQAAADLERLYSPEEAADYLGIHVQTVRAWIRSGRLTASRLAGQRALRIRASDLQGVLEPVEPVEAVEAEGSTGPPLHA
ncbi:MAG: helix-turn-helix domain-containing protein [Chloroflexi bacterium]|nr:helix-turn-helix domain-containing protein [Chloroflexota bacterium]